MFGFGNFGAIGPNEPRTDAERTPNGSQTTRKFGKKMMQNTYYLLGPDVTPVTHTVERRRVGHQHRFLKPIVQAVAGLRKRTIPLSTGIQTIGK